MTCERCGGLMRIEHLSGGCVGDATGVTMWTCYLCGNVADQTILRNRARVMPRGWWNLDKGLPIFKPKQAHP